MYVEKFAQGKIPFLIIVGPTSTGKSEAIREVIKKVVMVDGNISLINFYEKLCDFKDWHFVLDDLPPKFYKDDDCNAILKALTNSTTSTPDGNVVRYDKQSVSQTEIVTKSRVILIANSWANASPHVKALEARAITLMFEPTNYEIHKEVAKWFNDQEVYDYIYELLPLMDRNNMRLYVTGKTLKSAGVDWQTSILQMVTSDKAVQLFLQMRDRVFKSETVRARAFARELGVSERTYWRLKKKLEKTVDEEVGENLVLKKK